MENQEQQVEQQVEQPAQPELGIADLQNLKTLVEMAIRRGAYSPNEISSVGAVYDRVAAFLNAVAPVPTPEGEQAQEQAAQ
jgi:hypothetical protein